MTLRTVLITGCSEGGLGAALAKAFQEQGYHVFATLRNPAKAGSLAGEHGTNIDVLTLDTTSKESIDACLETARAKTGGKLDVLVNNAGFGSTMPMLHASIEEARAIYDVNVWGTLSLVQAFSPLLLESKGVIMNICSIVGAANVAWQGKRCRCILSIRLDHGRLTESTHLGIYNSSKAAETMISESLRIELEPLGVRVMTVMLGQVSTQMYANTVAFQLPEGSPYEKIASFITRSSKGDLNHNNEPANVVARNLVRDTISGRRGQIWRGGLARTVYLALWLLPTRLFEWIVHLKRGVYDI
jgi:NAD(P)-dependent dehydrogenase (short-subunit alcohol dehydrogenase family)